jgi:hypothetical protein
MPRILLSASLRLMLGAGCGGGEADSSKPRATTYETTYEVALEPAPRKIRARASRTSCFPVWSNSDGRGRRTTTRIR